MRKPSDISVAWCLFPGPGIPENALGESPDSPGEELLLSNGVRIRGIEVPLPESGMMNLNDLLPARQPYMTRSLLVGECEVLGECTVLLGISVNWNWDVRLNGELLCDAKPFRNGEHSFWPDDHLVRCHLRRGRNLFACDIGNGEDFQIGLKLFEDEENRLKWRPLAHFPDASRNAVSITFELTFPAPGGLLWRREGETEWHKKYDTLGGQIRRDTAIHHVRLAGLAPDSFYEYQVFMMDEPAGWEERPLGTIEQFQTLPDNGSCFSFVATADLQNLDERREWMTALFNRDYAKKAAFFAYLGDVSWTSNFDKAVIQEFIGLYQTASNNSKLLQFVRGNHEYYGREAQRFFEYFSAPDNGKEGYSMFRCGDVCFIVLDFGDDCGRCPYPSTRSLHCIDSYLEEQKSWLERMIEQPICKEARYRIVLAHAIPFGDWQEYLPGKVHRVIDPFFAGENPRCPIHLWLGGHVHYPLRSIPGRNAFRSRRGLPFHSQEEKDALKKAGVLCGDNVFFPVVVFSGPSGNNPPELQLSDVEVVVTPEALEVTSRDRDGTVYDRFTITPEHQVNDLFSSEDFPVWNAE